MLFHVEQGSIFMEMAAILHEMTTIGGFQFIYNQFCCDKTNQIPVIGQQNQLYNQLIYNTND